jgi:hypothetical protein
MSETPQETSEAAAPVAATAAGGGGGVGDDDARGERENDGVESSAAAATTASSAAPRPTAKIPTAAGKRKGARRPPTDPRKRELEKHLAEVNDKINGGDAKRASARMREYLEEQRKKREALTIKRYGAGAVASSSSSSSRVAGAQRAGQHHIDASERSRLHSHRIACTEVGESTPGMEEAAARAVAAGVRRSTPNSLQMLQSGLDGVAPPRGGLASLTRSGGGSVGAGSGGFGGHGFGVGGTGASAIGAPRGGGGGGGGLRGGGLTRPQPRGDRLSRAGAAAVAARPFAARTDASSSSRRRAAGPAGASSSLPSPGKHGGGWGGGGEASTPAAARPTGASGGTAGARRRGAVGAVGGRSGLPSFEDDEEEYGPEAGDFPSPAPSAAAKFIGYKTSPAAFAATETAGGGARGGFGGGVPKSQFADHTPRALPTAYDSEDEDDEDDFEDDFGDVPDLPDFVGTPRSRRNSLRLAEGGSDRRVLYTGPHTTPFAW